MKYFFKILFAVSLTATLSVHQAQAQSTDVGITSILSPVGSFCGGLNDVIVVVSNFGTNDVNSLNIDWSVDNVPQTQLVYLNPLLTGESDTINLGAYNFSSAANIILSATTSFPNGIQDDDPANDGFVSSGLSTRFSAGTYTIGGAGADYNNLSAAINALSNYGICGSVVFNINSTIDTVRLSIPAITGTSQSSTITFQSAALNADSVKFTAPSDPSFGNPNYVLRLDGADHITFRHVTFERSGIEPYARVFELRNTACFNTITNCKLTGSSQNQVANSLAAVVYSSFGTPTNDSNFTFTNNAVRNGSIGYYMNGLASLNPETGGIVSNNLFLNQFSRAIAVSNQGSLVIEYNTISTSSAYTQYTAMELDRSQRNQRVSKNRISGNIDIGINLIDCSGFNGTPGVISNNFIQCTDSIGVRMDNGEYQLLAYNSVNVNGTAVGSAARFSGAGTGNFIRNNIFKHSAGGQSIVTINVGTVGIASMNYNDLFTTGSVLGIRDGVSITDLSSWKSANTSDTNSVSADPYFASASSLYPTSVAIDNAGIAIPNIADDIDGTSRSSTAPDIGAVEFIGTIHDIASTAFLSPSSGDCGNDATDIIFVISNTGAAPETGFSWSISTPLLATPISGTYNDTLAAGSSDTISVTGALNTSAGGPIPIQLTVTATRDDNRSNDTLSTFVNIIAIPGAPTASADSVCLGSVSSLSASGSGSIDWFNTAIAGNILATGPNFTTGPLSSTSTFYVSTTVSGCESPRTPVTAVIFPLPIIQLGPNLSIIQGDTATFDAGAGFTSYQWNTGATTQSIQVTDSGCYMVMVTNGFGCTATDDACLQLVLATDLFVGNLVSPINGLCASGSTPLTIQLNNSGPNIATNIPISVSLGGGATGTLTGSVPGPLNPGDSVIVSLGNINTSSGGNVIINVTVLYNAEADPTNDNYSDTVFLPAEPALPSATDAARCGTGSVILSASASLPVLWYDAPVGGVLLFVGNSYTITNLTQTTTLYLQAGTFCVGQSRQPITATLLQLPTVNIGADTSLILPYQLDAGAGFASYSWNTGETTQTIVANLYGSYSVTVVDQNGCSNSDTIALSGTVSIRGIDYADGMRLFPNPNSGYFTIWIPGNLPGDLSFEVFNMNGSTVSKGLLPLDSSGNKYQLKLDGLSNGIYSIKVVATDGIQRSLRFVIQ